MNGLEENTFDIREDSVQFKKCDETLELLVAAGYYRARIKGLNNFDKIVGGLVWCIETCNFDVDILLFQEDWSIGKKIALTEKIVSVLKEMKCPHAIEPHQIQGQDYKNIFPIFQWLVGQVLETREERSDYIREVSKWHCGQHFDLRKNSGFKPNTVLEDLSQSYAPRRCYKQKSPPKDFSNPEMNVSQTLLEYDFKRGMKKLQAENNIQANPADDELLDLDESEARVTAKTVSNLIKIQSEELQRAALNLSALKEKLEKEQELSSPVHLSTFIHQLEEKSSLLEEKIQKLKIERDQLSNELKAVDLEVEELQSITNQMANEYKNSSVNLKDKSTLEQLQLLVTQNEELKKKETEFKKLSKQKLKEMEERNQKLAEKLKSVQGKPSRDDNNVKEDERKLELLREELSSKSLQLGCLEKKLDSFASRYELEQYQRRFFELEQQVSSEFSECQQFVTLNNTLIDQKSFMDKEVAILNVILDSNKTQTVDQMSRLLQGILAIKEKAAQMHNEQQIILDDSNSQLMTLLDEQREYNLLVREMRDEMTKNEAMAEKLSTEK